MKINKIGLSNAESKLVVDSIDYVINNTFDLLNEQRLSQGRPMTNITVLFSNIPFRNQMLKVVRSVLSEKIEFASPYQRVILQTALDNFDGTLRYYAERSTFLKSFDVETEIDEDGNIVLKGWEPNDSVGQMSSRDSAFDRSGNNTSIDERMPNEVRYLLSTLTEKNEDGTDVLNDLGFPKLYPFNKIKNRITKLLEGKQDEKRMFDILAKNIETYPELAQLVVRLGDPADYEGNSAKFNLWMKFRQPFGGFRVPQMEQLLEVNDRNELVVKFTPSRPDTNKVLSEFKANFMYALPSENEYITVIDGQNVLNVKKLLDDVSSPYFASGIEGREYKPGTSDKLFKALGIRYDKNDAIKAELDELEKRNNPVLSNITDALYLIYLTSEKLKRDKDSQYPNGILITDPLTQLVGKLNEGIEVTNKRGEVKTKKHSGENTNVNKLLEIQARHSDDYANYSVINPEGKREWEHSLPNMMLQQFGKLNDFEKYPTLQDVLAEPSMWIYDQTKNPLMIGNKFLKEMFYPDGRRYIDKKTGKPITIDTFNVSGLKDISGDSSEGLKTGSLNKQAKFMMDVNGLLGYGITTTLQHASKSTYFGIKLSSPSSGDPNLYYPNEWFITDNHIYDPLKDILIGELTTIGWLNQGVGSNFKGYAERAKELRVMDSLVFPEVKKKLLKLVEKGVPENLDELVDQMKTELEQGFQQYFNNLNTENNSLINPIFLNSEVVNKFKRIANSTTYRDITKTWNGDNYIKALVRSYTFNSFIHNVYTSRMMYGDPAFYALHKDEYHKRIPGAAAFKTTTSQSAGAFKYINDSGNLVAKNMGIESKAFDGRFNVRIYKDIKPQSDYYNSYVDYFAKFYENSFKVDTNTARKLAEQELDAYSKGEIKESDAQGIMTLDGWATISKLMGKWDDRYESFYQRAAKGEELTSEQLDFFFNILKLQYFGPLAASEESGYDGKLFAPVFHKFAVLPLIPSLIKGTALEAINRDMMEKNHHYLTFESGSKVANWGEPNSFFANDDYNKRDPYMGDKDGKFNINTVFTEFLGEQVNIEPHWKGKTVFSTQSRKLVSSGLFQEGIPTDYKGTREEWDNLSEKQKRKESNRYRVFQQYNDDIEHLSGILKKRLLKEAGIEQVGDSYSIPDFEPIVKILLDEFKRRDLPDDIIDFIDVVQDGKLKNPLDLSPYAQRIELIIQAIINNRLIRQKVNGEPLIQVANSGFNKIGFRNATSEEQIKYGSGLKFYEPGVGKNGTTGAMQVKIALAGDYLHLLNLEHNGRKIKVEPTAVQQARLDELRATEPTNVQHKRAIENEIASINSIIMEASRNRLNEALQDEQFRDKVQHLITLVGERIPVQGLNSMEFMEVAEFLPGEAGNVIILPTEIVAKSGGDYDLSILNVIKPNIKIFRKFHLSQELFHKLIGSRPDLDIGFKETEELYSNYNNPRVVYKLNRVEEIVIRILNSYFSEIKEVQLSNNELHFAENKIINSLKDILSLPENFVQLVRPRNINNLKILAEKLLPQSIQDRNHWDLSLPKKQSSVSALMEPIFNLNQFEKNSQAKEAFPITLIDNDFNNLFNIAGVYLNSVCFSGTYDLQGQPILRKTKIRLPHNKINNGLISLSHKFDVENRLEINKIFQEILASQSDLEKFDVLYDLKFNELNISVILLLLQAGTPLSIIVLFVNQKIILQYIELLKFKRNPYYKAVTLSSRLNLKQKARIQCFNQLFNKRFESFIEIQKCFSETEKKLDISLLFSMEGLEEINKSKEKEAILLYHYFELEELANRITMIKHSLRFDAHLHSGFLMVEYMKNKFEDAIRMNLVPVAIMNKIKNIPILKSFDHYSLMKDIHRQIMPLRNHPLINQFILKKINDLQISTIEKQIERFAFTFKNDLIQKLFQMNLNKERVRNMFIGDNTVPLRLHRIKCFYPELIIRYPVLKFLIPEKDKKNKKITEQLHNLRFWCSNLTPDLINDYRLQFNELIDFSTNKVPDKEQNENLTMFFRKLVTFAFLQSGLNKSHISFTELLPLNVIQSTFNIKPFSCDVINDAFLNDFYNQFQLQNKFFAWKRSNGSINPTPYRFKNYFS